MGQYHKIVNVDKGEYLNPWNMGTGAKAWEQAANSSLTPAAMFMLMANPEYRGGGDFEEGEYAGRWHGDRVIIIGDYAESDDIDGIDASAEYSKTADDTYTDISAGTMRAMLANGLFSQEEAEYIREKVELTDRMANS